MALCTLVMKSTQPLVKAIAPLCPPRLKIIGILHGIIVLKSAENGLGNKLLSSEWTQTKATLTNYIKPFTSFIGPLSPPERNEMKSDPALVRRFISCRKAISIPITADERLGKIPQESFGTLVFCIKWLGDLWQDVERRRKGATPIQWSVGANTP